MSIHTQLLTQARGNTVGLGTEKQFGRSLVRFPIVSLEFFLDLNLPATTMSLGSTQPLTEMSTSITQGVKAAGA